MELDGFRKYSAEIEESDEEQNNLFVSKKILDEKNTKFI